MNTAQTHDFQAQIQGQFKRQKKIQGSKRILQKNIQPKNLDITKSEKNKCSNLQKQGSKWPTQVWKRKKIIETKQT
jgi:hypothetical protein